MPTYAGITIANHADGVLYANAVPLTATEADLFNGTTTTIPNQDPIPVTYGQAIQAVVQLTVSGQPVSNLTYVVMQTDLGDGVWVDVAWCLYTKVNNPGTFVFSAGVAGNNSFEQTRTPGSAPASNGSNAMALGGRIRFVGKSTFAGGSSIAPGGFAGVLCTIKYKLLGLR